LDPKVSWPLQIFILATGIYMFLRFLRTSRGRGMLRGLLVTVSIGAIGLWGAAKYFELEELIHIIEGIYPYVAVILVILFQPELRRAMVRLGQHSRFARLLSAGRHETVPEVAAAAVAMAKRRHGALIAFQRETPLDAWTQHAAQIDAEVSRHLLESIFHPGAALHDGAVVIEGDRVVAAACLFPLTENIEISKSTGTRHRAALGLTEETDAITLSVSEETGRISLSHQGKMERNISAAELEPALRRYLGQHAAGESATKREGQRGTGRILAGALEFFTQDLWRKTSALLLSGGLIFIAHEDLLVHKPISLKVQVLDPGKEALTRTGFLSIHLPESIHLVRPASGDSIEVVVSGTRARTDRLHSFGGVLDILPDTEEGVISISVDEVSWIKGSEPLKIEWASAPSPTLVIARFDRSSYDLEPDCVPVDDTNLDPHFVVHKDDLIFASTSIEIEGPPTEVQAILDGELPFRLQEIRVAATDQANKRVQLGLASELVQRGISIVGDQTVGVTLPIEPAPHPLGEVEMDIVVTNMSPDSDIDPKLWTIAQQFQKARFALNSAGLFESDPGTEAFTETFNRIKSFVEANMDVYVDVSEFPEEGSAVPVHYDFPRDWQGKLFAGREAELAPSALLEVKLVSDEMILLTKK
jgi:diadenylate cyclase